MKSKASHQMYKFILSIQLWYEDISIEVVFPQHVLYILSTKCIHFNNAQQMARTISTKNGDNGTTSLLGGEKLPKHHPRIEVIGSIDEFNSYLGVVRSLQPPKEIDELLETLQHYLFIAGTDVAATGATSISHIEPHHLEAIEKALETIESSLPDLSSFVLPGGSPISAHLHVARTLCRKVERTLSTLASIEPVNPLLMAFFNRCSDLLFVLARFMNSQSGFPEDTIA